MAAALLGVVGTTVAVTLTIALWPPERRSGLLSELPPIPTIAPPAADPNAPPGSTPPSADAWPPTVVPSAPPPLPPDPTSPPASPTNPPRQPPPPRLAPVSFEAESAVNTLGGSAKIHNVPEASGGHTIGNLGRGSANTLRFNRIGTPAAGTYTLTVFYLSGDGDRIATVKVNGRLIGRVTFPATGDWQTVGSLAVRITLDAGNNSIEFGNPDGPAPDFDRLTVAS